MAYPPVRVRDLPPGYPEWPAPAGLRHALSCLWAQVTPDGCGDRDGLVLPDACTDLIWEQGRGPYVAGPDTGPVPTVIKAGTIVLGVRFRPWAGGPALGVPLSEVRDQRVDLDDLRRRDARRLPGQPRTWIPLRCARWNWRPPSSPTATPTRPRPGPRSCWPIRRPGPKTSQRRSG